MSGRTIHEVPLVSEVKGGMKIPISDGGNLPQTASVEQINKFISDQIRIYVNDLLKRYVEKIDGKGLSTNDFTNTLKSKLDSLSNYDDTQIVSNIAKLQNVLDTLVSGDISSKIESFNEIISFLENVEDSESFEGIVSGITNSIKGIEVKLTELGSRVNDLGSKHNGSKFAVIPSKFTCTNYNTGELKETESLSYTGVLFNVVGDSIKQEGLNIISAFNNYLMCYSAYPTKENYQQTYLGRVPKQGDTWVPLNGTKYAIFSVEKGFTDAYIEQLSFNADYDSSFVLNKSFTDGTVIGKQHLVKETIKGIFISEKDMPSDMSYDENGNPNIFLRQILVDYPSLGTRIWLSYENTSGEMSYTNQMIWNAASKDSSRVYSPSGHSYADVNFNAPSVMGESRQQPFFTNTSAFKLNPLKTLSQIEEDLHKISNGFNLSKRIVRFNASTYCGNYNNGAINVGHLNNAYGCWLSVKEKTWYKLYNAVISSIYVDKIMCYSGFPTTDNYADLYIGYVEKTENDEFYAPENTRWVCIVGETDHEFIIEDLSIDKKYGAITKENTENFKYTQAGIEFGVVPSSITCTNYNTGIIADSVDGRYVGVVFKVFDKRLSQQGLNILSAFNNYLMCYSDYPSKENYESTYLGYVSQKIDGTWVVKEGTKFAMFVVKYKNIGFATIRQFDDSLEDRLTQIENNIKSALSEYTLYTIGDSMSASGKWQTQLSKKTGISFSQERNVKPGASLSVGGTPTYGSNMECAFWRVKNLINQNYISDGGKNTVIILENVNDGTQQFDKTARTFRADNIIDGGYVFDSEFLSSILESNRSFNSVIKTKHTAKGKKLTINTLPTQAGTVVIKTGWAGPGKLTYNIEVTPQSTEEETLAHVLDKILEYNYTGVTDILSEDGNSVIFSNGLDSYETYLEFVGGNTGMTCTITETNDAAFEIPMFFKGETLNEWTDTSKWQSGVSYSEAWKSIIELLQETYPFAKICIAYFPATSLTASDYKKDNGLWDVEAFKKDKTVVNMEARLTAKKDISDYYNLPLLDVYNEWGVSLANYLTYYPTNANIHCNDNGQARIGDVIAAQLKGIIV